MTTSSQSRVFLIFCDGTGADGNLVIDKDDPGHPVADDILTQRATNVLRLSRSVKSKTTDGRAQIVFYQNGVGSEANFAGTFDGSLLDIFKRLQKGTAVASKIRDVYAFLAQNYEEGDEICLFGYSRGAYTARKVAGLIDKIGLLTRENLGQFFTIWKDLVDRKHPNIPHGTRRVRIRCVGVWDTVGSIMNVIDALSIKDTSLPPIIDCALHALSIQENRLQFLPTLWTVPTSGLTTTASGNSQVLKQIWFPGAHSDVGGGYKHHELSDLALFWMAGEIRDFINLDLEFLFKTRQKNPIAWGTYQPHNAYQELPSVLKAIIQPETRLESQQLTADAVYHPSFAVSPAKVNDPISMVTLPLLREAFGASWNPTYSELNAWEQECKKRWNQPPSNGPVAAFPQGPMFETPDILFDDASMFST